MRLLVYFFLLCLSHLILANTLQKRALSNVLTPHQNEHAIIAVRKLTLINLLSARQDDTSSSDDTPTNEEPTDPTPSNPTTDDSASAAAAEAAAGFSARISSDNFVISTDGLHPTLGATMPIDIPAMTTTMGGLGVETTITGRAAATSAVAAGTTSMTAHEGETTAESNPSAAVSSGQSSVGSGAVALGASVWFLAFFVVGAFVVVVCIVDAI